MQFFVPPSFSNKSLLLVCLMNYTNFYFQIQMHLSTCLTYILIIVSLSIIIFYIMYNPVIVIWTNLAYFVLWNDIQITVQYGFFFLWSTVHPQHIWMVNGPSVTVWQLFEFVHCPINVCGVSNKCNLKLISCAPCE